MSVNIVPALPAELAQMMKIDVACHDTPFSVDNWTAAEVGKPGKGGCRCDVAMPILEEDVATFFRGTALGFCMTRQIEATDETQVLGILRLAVLPDYQKQGIGTRLIEACLARAWSLNLKAVEIVLPSCECGKGKTSDFLASFGFKASRDIVEHYETTYGRDLDGYVFRLTLKGQL